MTDTYDYWAEVQIKLPVHLLLDQSKTFIVPLSSYACRLKLRESSEPFYSGLGQFSNTELVHDRRGLSRAMDAHIHIPGPLLDIDPGTITAEGPQDSDNVLKAVYAALAVVNKCIDTYRFLSGEFHVKRLSPSDLVGAWTGQVDWFMDRRYVLSSTRSDLGSGMTLARETAPDDFQNELQECLREGQVPLHVLLFLNARDYMEFDDYRMAIVESRSSLEVLVDGILSRAFSSKTVGQVREILKVKAPRGGRVSDIEGAIGSARINHKLKHGLRRAVGKSPADNTKLWRRWLTVKNIREQVVHYGQTVSKEQAEDHVATVQEIRDLLDAETASKNWKVTYVQSGSYTGPWFES